MHVGANVAKPLARMRGPANPTSYGPAQRGAALLCWARRNDGLRGALAGRWALGSAGRSGGWSGTAALRASVAICCMTRRCFDLL